MDSSEVEPESKIRVGAASCGIKKLKCGCDNIGHLAGRLFLAAYGYLPETTNLDSMSVGHIKKPALINYACLLFNYLNYSD